MKKLGILMLTFVITLSGCGNESTSKISNLPTIESATTEGLVEIKDFIEYKKAVVQAKKELEYNVVIKEENEKINEKNQGISTAISSATIMEEALSRGQLTEENKMIVDEQNNMIKASNSSVEAENKIGSDIKLLTYLEYTNPEYINIQALTLNAMNQSIEPLLTDNNLAEKEFLNLYEDQRIFYNANKTYIFSGSEFKEGFSAIFDIKTPANIDIYYLSMTQYGVMKLDGEIKGNTKYYITSDFECEFGSSSKASFGIPGEALPRTQMDSHTKEPVIGKDGKPVIVEEMVCNDEATKYGLVNDEGTVIDSQTFIGSYFN